MFLMWWLMEAVQIDVDLVTSSLTLNLILLDLGTVRGRRGGERKECHR